MPDFTDPIAQNYKLSSQSLTCKFVAAAVLAALPSIQVFAGIRLP